MSDTNTNDLFQKDEFELESFDDAVDSIKKEVVENENDTSEESLKAPPIPVAEKKHSGMIPSKYKKILVIGGAIFLSLLIIIGIIFLSSKDDSKQMILQNQAKSINEVTPLDNIDEIKLEKENLNKDNDIISTTGSSNTGIVLNDSVSSDSGIKIDNIKESNSTSNTILISGNSGDETIDITEAILSPSAVKISFNPSGEFDGFEKNNGNEAGFVRIKENSLVIPTVAKQNFVPDIKLDVTNTKDIFKVSDQIILSYNVLLNSKSLSYTISSKTYKDIDLVVELNLNPINTDIVSIENNFMQEEIVIPLALMNKGYHTVWFKLNGYPLTNYSFTIK